MNSTVVDRLTSCNHITASEPQLSGPTVCAHPPMTLEDLAKSSLTNYCMVASADRQIGPRNQQICEALRAHGVQLASALSMVFVLSRRC
jgi:hypothetical protein